MATANDDEQNKAGNAWGAVGPDILVHKHKSSITSTIWTIAHCSVAAWCNQDDIHCTMGKTSRG